MNQKGNKKSARGVGFVIYMLLLLTCLGAEAQQATPTFGANSTWEQLIQSHTTENLPVIQNRLVKKSRHFQLAGPYVGMSERKDFYNNYFLALGARYHFSESHGWEIIRGYWNFPVESALASEIRSSTGYRPDSQISHFQIASSYVFTPIYGKYAWSEKQIIHFDIFGTLGGGLRFAENTQPFVQLGLGTSHYVFSSSLALVPQFDLRVYSEQRSKPTLVTEGVFQLGIAWLL